MGEGDAGKGGRGAHSMVSETLIERSQAAQEAEAQGIAAAAAALLTLAGELRGMREREQIGRAVARLLPALFGADRCALVLRTSGGGDVVSSADELAEPDGLPALDPSLLAERAVVEEPERAVVLTDVDAATGLGGRSRLVIPFRAGDELLGSWTLEFTNAVRPDARQVALGDAVSRFVALALESAGLAEREHATARLQGAIETARGLAHELSHPLSIVAGEAEILQRMTAPSTPIADVSPHLSRLLEASRRLAERIQRVQRIVRVEVRETAGVGPYIDLERSCQPEWVSLGTEAEADADPRTGATGRRGSERSA